MNNCLTLLDIPDVIIITFVLGGIIGGAIVAHFKKG